MISNTSRVHTVFDVLTPYDLAVRIGRGVATTALAGTCANICLDSLLALPSQLHRFDSYTAGMAASALLTGVAAYKCATRVIKEIKAPMHEKEIPQLLEDPSKDEAILFLQAKRDWSGDITCQTRSTMKMLRELSSRYALFRERVGSIEEINQAINKLNKTGKKIKMVAIMGHGTSSGVMLGSFVCRDLNSDTVSKIDFKAIEGSKLVLLSCYGGIFAKTIQQAAGPSIAIQGTSSMLGPRCIKIEDLKAPTFSFVSPFIRGKDTTIHMNYEKANSNSWTDRLAHTRSVFMSHITTLALCVSLGITPVLVQKLIEDQKYKSFA